ncbi:hypothetical protein [Photorhabdus luminescens]|uniref:Uncharacterized protein n=1 Tax=Photorhabdus luminescens subsp. mexicana TaxID=2100167 RepID=A0A4R4J3G9_PHOLU|nr:hypothetical protein [Photorhabdus luminescens]TDB48054.1 hypothetical protein C5468_16755 [Photorhabdus luminescens subsp. mexicana]
MNKELTLSELLTQRCVNFTNSEKAIEIIDDGIEKLFKDLVSDTFRSYSDFGRLLTKSFENALPNNISDVIDLQKYNHMIVSRIKEEWVKSSIHNDIQQRIIGLTEEFTSEIATPKHIMASKLWEAFIGDNQEQAHREGWESPQIIINEHDNKYIWVGLDPRESNSYFYSNETSVYGCEIMLALSPKGADEENRQIYELFSGHLNNSDILGGKVISAYSKFDKLIMSLYYGGSLLVWDESPEDISYPSYD